MNFAELRHQYHQDLCRQVLGIRSGILNIADRSSKKSKALAFGILEKLELPPCEDPPVGQRAGALFEVLTKDYLQEAFSLLSHIRPGQWEFSVHSDVAEFVQYEHLKDIVQVLAQHPTLRATLGDYLVTPDIVIGRLPVSDADVNKNQLIYSGQTARLTSLRANNVPDNKQILHASVSCKWTIRSDRSQNARTEALNLIRNRKGNTPHIVVVTAEPLPNRIASLALGTGDLDCVYHIALYELLEVVAELDDETSQEMLNLLVDGRRLRDISDLPFDLAA